MSFFTGLVTGLAKSVDEQLKKDMQRTQDRIDGMAQYRVTRRRADLERQDKEKDELRDSIKRLASLVDGDTTKAIQMYKAVGNNIADANAFYKVADKSKRTLGEDFDISKAVEFASIKLPSNVNKTDFLNNFIDGSVKQVKPLPAEDADVSGGLYSALFKPKIGEQIMKQTDAIAPLPKEKKVDTSFITPAKINYNEFLEYKDYQKKNRPKAAGSYEGEIVRLLNEKSLETDNTKIATINTRIETIKELIKKDKELSRRAGESEKTYFSKEGLTRIFKSNYMLNVDKKYLGGTGVGESLSFALEGNEVPVFVGKKRTLKSLKDTYGDLDDTVFNAKLKAEEDNLAVQMSDYRNKVKIDSQRPVGEKKLTASYIKEENANIVKQKIQRGQYKVGDVVEYKDNNNVTRVVIVTPSGVI